MKYIANPSACDAWKILTVGEVDPDTGKRQIELEEIGTRFATKEMCSRMVPVPGDYFVIQEFDGYVYLNPKDVFERKYRPA
jgi:hypothetical protein